MQGVEILTSAQVATVYAANFEAFWVTALIIFGVFIVLGFAKTLIDGEWCELLGCSVIGVVIGPLSGLIASEICMVPTVHETQYQITISDEVSMTEFYEHYEVIDQDGKIFTVREKTNE